MNTPQQKSRSWYVPRYSAYSLIALYILAMGLAPILTGVLIGLEGSARLAIIHLSTIAGIAFILGLKNIRAALLVSLLFLPWQPLLSMPLADALGQTGIRMLSATKDVYIVVLLSVLYLRNGRKVKSDRTDLAVALFLLVYLLFALISPANLFGIATSLREGFMVVAFYLVGRFSLLNLNGIRWFLRTIVILSLFVALFGYVERFLFTEKTWESLGSGAYIEAKRGIPETRPQVEYNVPRNWYNLRKDGSVYRRMVSSVGDPTGLSRFLSLPVLALLYLSGFFRKSFKHFSIPLLMLSLLSGALLLTFGRGGLLIVMGGVMIWAVTIRPGLALFMVPAVVLLLFTLPVLDLQSGSVPMHISHGIRGFQELFRSPFGRGLGTAGQKAVYYSDQAVEGTGDSYLAALAFQTGIPGMLTYSLFMSTIALRLLRISKNARKNGNKNDNVFEMALLGFSIVTGIFLTSLFSSNAVAAVSSGSSMLFCGALIGFTSWRRKRPISLPE